MRYFINGILYGLDYGNTNTINYTRNSMYYGVSCHREKSEQAENYQVKAANGYK